MKNPCGKTVKWENAYEVWQGKGSLSDWYWYVLKKWQSPDREAENEYARWFCLVKTPIVPDGEYGDTYVKDIKANAIRIK